MGTEQRALAEAKELSRELSHGNRRGLLGRYVSTIDIAEILFIVNF